MLFSLKFSSSLPFTSPPRPQLAARRKTPQFPNHHPRLASLSSPHRPLRSQPRRRYPIHRHLLDKLWLVVGLASSSIKVFSTHIEVLARTLVGDESGVWGVCLVEKGGWREGGEGVKEGGRGSSGERREMKERKKQKQRERQPERGDREKTPRPSRESASVALVPDPDSKKGIVTGAKRKTERRRNVNHGGRRHPTKSLLLPTYALRLMIAFEMKQLEGHLRLHIMRGDQVQVRRQQPYQLLRSQVGPGEQGQARQHPRGLGNIHPRFHMVFKIERTSSRIYRSHTL